MYNLHMAINSASNAPGNLMELSARYTAQPLPVTSTPSTAVSRGISRKCRPRSWPHANPAKAGDEPKSVAYEFERDSMKPYPSYLIQSLTMGMLHTVLPGGKKKN